jgi:hypothetical protein
MGWNVWHADYTVKWVWGAYSGFVASDRSLASDRSAMLLCFLANGACSWSGAPQTLQMQLCKVESEAASLLSLVRFGGRKVIRSRYAGDFALKTFASTSLMRATDRSEPPIIGGAVPESDTWGLVLKISRRLPSWQFLNSPCAASSR